MLKEERQHYILNHLKTFNRVYITSLSEELSVSDDTLRRDLVELDNKGLLTKVHGGAIAKSSISFEFTDRLNTDMTSKQEMASKVIPLFRPGDVLLIDGGTSNLEVARQIPVDLKMTIYTNSFPIVNVLLNHPNLDILFLGGKIFPSSQVTVGLSVFQMLQTIRPDWLVLGVCSIHPQLGLTDPHREESMVKRIMIERAQKRIILADSHKLNTAEPYCIGSLGDIDYLVVENSKTEYLKQNWKGLTCNIL